MKASELRAMTDAEIAAALRTARDEEFRLRLQHHTGQVVNTSKLGEARRQVARILTVQKERAATSG